MRGIKATRRSTAMLVGCALACMSILVGVQVAASKPAVAAPTITAKPADPAASTSATFAFTGPAGATFRCSLDGSSATSCVSPKLYSGLAQGGHTFKVTAVVGATSSSETAYSWTVDTIAPPVPSITSGPSQLSNTTSATLAFADSEIGVGFRCSIDGGSAIACTSPRTYSGLTQGPHSFSVSAVDAAGNVSPAATRAWSVDSVAPPAPVLTTRPSNPTSNATNVFAWTDSEVGVEFQCSLENGAWTACATPYTWVIDTTNNQQHQFAVRALDGAGNASAVTAYTFKYEKGLPDSGLPFTISGDVGQLAIGVWRPINVTITNPNPVTIFVSSVTVAIGADSTPPGCLTGPNIELQQSNISSTTLLAVPGNSSLQLPAQGASAPMIRLKNLPTVNQDVCKGKSFTLTYSGTATN